MPLVNPVTAIGDVAPVPVNPPGLEVSVYEVTGDPFAGAAEKNTVAEAFPGTAFNAVAAPGIVNGVTAADGADAGPVPAMY